MTHFCTSIQRHADFEICQKLPLKELIFEHQSLSRFGELETATLLEMLEAWKTNEGKVISIIESHILMETGTYRIKVVNSGHNYAESMDHGPNLATIRLS